MKLAHNIKLSVFSHEEDDLDKLAQTITKLCPFDLEQEKLQLKQSTATGFKERKIKIFEILLTKERHTTKFLNHLKQNLSDDQRQLLINQTESRLDQELDFFIRLDKQKLLNENQFWITDSGNCFHIKISIAAYPANRETGLKVVKEWLE
jgi:RNA binding exosome subunit